MLNLESLSLSVNRVASLRVFANRAKMDLHLRKTDIADLDEVRLVGLDRLRTLWLCDNRVRWSSRLHRVGVRMRLLLLLDGA